MLFDAFHKSHLLAQYLQCAIHTEEMEQNERSPSFVDTMTALGLSSLNPQITGHVGLGIRLNYELIYSIRLMGCPVHHIGNAFLVINRKRPGNHVQGQLDLKSLLFLSLRFGTRHHQLQSQKKREHLDQKTKTLEFHSGQCHPTSEHCIHLIYGLERKSDIRILSFPLHDLHFSMIENQMTSHQPLIVKSPSLNCRMDILKGLVQFRVIIKEDLHHWKHCLEKKRCRQQIFFCRSHNVPPIRLPSSHRLQIPVPSSDAPCL